MKYKCKFCGLEKKQGDYTMTNEELQDIFKHEQTHKENDKGIPKNRG